MDCLVRVRLRRARARARECSLAIFKSTKLFISARTSGVSSIKLSAIHQRTRNAQRAIMRSYLANQARANCEDFESISEQKKFDCLHRSVTRTANADITAEVQNLQGGYSAKKFRKLFDVVHLISLVQTSIAYSSERGLSNWSNRESPKGFA
jgi:hypothetical protein